MFQISVVSLLPEIIEPVSRYGVMSSSGPPVNLFAHAAAHETGIALCLTLIVLLVRTPKRHERN